MGNTLRLPQVPLAPCIGMHLFKKAVDGKNITLDAAATFGMMKAEFQGNVTPTSGVTSNAEH